MSEDQGEVAVKKVWDIDYARKVLLNYPCYHERLGGVESLNISEIGDGNLNYIYVVAGLKETIVLKIVCIELLWLIHSHEKAPPFVRVLPEWPMSTKRAFYEYSALVEEYKVCPAHVPEVFGYHPEEALIVMKFIQPHIILRKGMMAGVGL
jgi:5-methylthioribose kinase